MIDFSSAADALTLLLSNPMAWVVVPIGIVIGLIFGVLPGLSIPVALAVFLPFTLYMDFLSAILFLTAIFTGGGFGSAVPAILMNVPGTSASIATCFDGYPMTRQGRHNEALGLALAASTVGLFVGYVMLLLLIDPLSRAVLRLGAPEMFMVGMWGLLLVAALAEGHFWRGVVAGAIGLLIGTVGMSTTGAMRGTMGSMYLLDGVDTTVALIGLFAASELFILAKSDYIVSDSGMRKVNVRLLLKGFADAFRKLGILLRGSVIGAFIGTVPGMGSTVANLISYTSAKAMAKSEDKASYGKGNPAGVIAAESANSSSEGGSMVGLLALGIPSSAGTAVMLGAFAMHNVTGGPRFISDNKDLVYAIIVGNLAQAAMLVIIGLLFIRICVMAVQVPLRYLVPTITALAILGAYALTGSMIGPVTLVAGALLGLVMKRYNFPVVCMVIGLLLGQLMESNLLRSWQLQGGDMTIFLNRPISLGMIIALAVTLAFILFRQSRLKKRELEEPRAEGA